MTWWRDICFLTTGMSRFTKQAYEGLAKGFSSLDAPEVLAAASGRECMITGANSGVGYAAAEALVQRGVTVHMVCRSEQRGREARDRLQQAADEAGRGASVQLHLLDMSSVPQVRAFGEAFARSGRALDALVNNAGCMVRRGEDDELDPNTVVNLVSTCVLTEALLPALRRNDGRRAAVVTVSSGGMLSSELHTDVARRHEDKVKAYASNKRAQVALTELWAREHEDLDFYAMHPGWADTPALKNSMPDFHRRFNARLRTPYQGADTVVWAVLRREELEAVERGAFLLDRTAQPKHLPLAWTKYKPEDAEAMRRSVLAAADARPTAEADRERYAYLAAK